MGFMGPWCGILADLAASALTRGPRGVLTVCARLVITIYRRFSSERSGRMTPVVILGAGMGGLAAAVELARRGEEVIVLESRDEIGGKARAVSVGGRTIDVGPTVLTMRWVFDELFASARRDLASSVELAPLHVIARHEFADGARLDLYPEVERNVDAIGRMAGAREAAQYRLFAAHCAAIAETVEAPFLRAQRPTISSLVFGAGRLGLGALRSIDAHRTMWSAIRSFFSDPRLVALFARYATYVGSSPFEASATFNLISHVERTGVVAVKGGVSRLASAMGDLATSLGATIRTSSRVLEVTASSGQVTGVRVARPDGTEEWIAARAIVANADVATIAAGRYGAEAARGVTAPPRSRRSLSAVTWAIAGSATGFDLAHHNVFFGQSYEAETKELWSARALPTDPTVYLCAPEAGAQFLIVNAPAGEGALTREEIDACETRVFSRLRRAGLTLTSSAIARMTPEDFARLAPGTGGAIYGEAAHGPMASLSRPPSRTKLRGLYVAGGSVHPGPGVPMAALSGRLSADAVLEDFASTRRSRRAATSGSISMR